MRRIEVLPRRSFLGFTLVELMVGMAILSVLLAITLVAINPLDQFAKSRNTKRRADVEALANAIHQYTAANKGSFPQGLSTTLTPIASSGVDVCTIFVPEYIAALPQDPNSNNGTRIPEAECSSYDTGYEVILSDDDHFVVEATSAELEEEIVEIR